MARLSRGYSLIEIAVAMAIAAIIGAAAVGIYSTLSSSMFAVRAQSRIDTQLQRVGRVLAADLQEIGGGSVRPWHALYVQPTPAKPDAILMLTADTASAGCSVDEYDVDDRELDLDLLCGACTVPVFPGEENPFVGRFAVLSMPGSGESRVIILRSRSMSGGGCRFEADPFIDSDVDDADDRGWDGSSLTVVDARWMFVDTTKHELRAWLLYASTAALSRGVAPDPAFAPRAVLAPYAVDERLVATQVYDFQVALGFDVDYDNIVVDAVDGAGDEWFGNAAGELPATDWIGDNGSEFTSPLVFDASHAVQQIRMRAAVLGLVMGMPARGAHREPVRAGHPG